MSGLSFYDQRKIYRYQLHAERVKDHDHSEERLWGDARKLDKMMVSAGYKLEFKSTWGENPETRAKTKAKTKKQAA